MRLTKIVERLEEALNRAEETKGVGDTGYVEAYGALSIQVEFAAADLRALLEEMEADGIVYA